MSNTATDRLPDRIQSFFRIASEEGTLQAFLAAGEDTLPSPYWERFAFARAYLNGLSDEELSGPAIFQSLRRGLLPKSYNLYRCSSNEMKWFVSDLDEKYASTINGNSKILLDDKGKFHALLRERGFTEYLPAEHGTLNNGTIIEKNVDFFNLLEGEAALVVKSRKGAAGQNVHIFEFDGRCILLNGEVQSEGVLSNRMPEFNGYLVTEFVNQADYSESLFPGTPNTIRILTMNPSNHDPFIASTVHRIGTGVSGKVDNFSQGGLSAQVQENGKLSPAVRYVNGQVKWYSTHPDTGSQIAGVRVPRWDTIREEILMIAKSLPEFKYVGWDIIVTGEGEFKIIEGNSNSDTDLLQAHEPLLRDATVRSFYRKHGISV